MYTFVILLFLFYRVIVYIFIIIIYTRNISFLLKSSKLVIGSTKAFTNGKALSYEGHTHNYAAASHNHAAGNITSGTLGVARGGTGKASFTANRLIYPSASTTLTQLAFPTTAGSVLRQGTSGAPYWTPVADLMTAMGGSRIQIGSYVGTCKYGPSNPNKVTLSFSPKLFILMEPVKAVYVESLTGRAFPQYERVAYYTYGESFYKFGAMNGGGSTHFAKKFSYH